MNSGRFELRQEDTGRRYWWGSEEEWKDATEIGEDGVLTLAAEVFAVGTVLHFSEPSTMFDEGTRVRVLRGPHAGTGTIVSSSSETVSYVRLDGSAVGADYLIAHDDLALLPATPALEQFVAAAQAAGAAGIWLVRGATEAELRFTDEPDPDAHLPWAQLALTPPHDLIVLIRFRDSDGGEDGVEFRQFEGKVL